MANSPTKTLRIKPGSALDRLTADAPDFTARLHHMADVLELAMKEEERRERVASLTQDAQTSGAYDEPAQFRPVDYGEHDPHAPGYERQGREMKDQDTRDQFARDAGVEIPGNALRPSVPLPPVSWEHASVKGADEATMLAAAREQYPAGLEPIGVLHPGRDELDDDDEIQSEIQTENAADEDLSDLI